MLSSGYEGVREIQKRLTNTLGWSATSGSVDNWVYEEANGRGYWETSEENLEKLRTLYMEVEDKIEGVE